MNQESNGNGTAAQPAKKGALYVLANIISYVLHPLFIPTLLAIALYKLMPASFAGAENGRAVRWIAVIGMTTVFYPMLTVLLLKGLGFISSIKMQNPRERIIPLIATIIFYFWMYLVSKGTGFPFMLKSMILGSYWGVILLFIINIFFKVSMHTTAIGGAVGVMILLLYNSPVNMMAPLFVAIVLAGLVGTARLVLRAHTPREVWTGYFLGILVQVAAFIYLR